MEFWETGRKSWHVFHENYFVFKVYPGELCRVRDDYIPALIK